MTHTPGPRKVPAGTRPRWTDTLPCGCVVANLCPMHTQAPAMLESLRRFVWIIDLWNDGHNDATLADLIINTPFELQVRAILRAVEGDKP